MKFHKKLLTLAILTSLILGIGVIPTAAATLTPNSIESLYIHYFGRNATGQEVGYWNGKDSATLAQRLSETRHFLGDIKPYGQRDFSLAMPVSPYDAYILKSSMKRLAATQNIKADISTELSVVQDTYYGPSVSSIDLKAHTEFDGNDGYARVNLLSQSDERLSKIRLRALLLDKNFYLSMQEYVDEMKNYPLVADEWISFNEDSEITPFLNDAFEIDSTQLNQIDIPDNIFSIVDVAKYEMYTYTLTPNIDGIREAIINMSSAMGEDMTNLDMDDLNDMLEEARPFLENIIIEVTLNPQTKTVESIYLPIHLSHESLTVYGNFVVHFYDYDKDIPFYAPTNIIDMQTFENRFSM